MFVINNAVAINLDYVERIEKEESSIFFHMQSGEKEYVEYETKEEASQSFFRIVESIDNANRENCLI